MQSRKIEAESILQDIEAQKRQIYDLISSGCAITHPMVVKASQELDVSLNLLYRLYPSRLSPPAKHSEL
ncbi:MAG: Spo0E family sporulation regulatory protein-aspartic acid phosphatase [Bacillota bacterium]|jgi:plasmid maintenance system antidote protein VapI